MKITTIKSFIAFYLVLFTGFAHSAEWFHQRLDLVSEDGAETITVSVDYQLFHTGARRYQYSAEYATPLHINVWANGQKVGGQVYLSSLSYNRYHGFDYSYYLSGQGKSLLRSVGEQVVELNSEGRYLTGLAANSVYVHGGGYGKRDPSGIQEIAVLIDGIWFKGFNGQNAMINLFDNAVNR